MIGSVIQEETSMEKKMGKLNMLIYLSNWFDYCTYSRKRITNFY